jgi:AcrR family transcriptional regulator
MHATLDTTLDTAERGTQRRGDVTRQALLDAALVEFAASGFDAASTRAIARRAGVHQGQLTYHFASKDALWQATVEHLFDRFDDRLVAAATPLTLDDRNEPTRVFARSIRALVRAVAELPELNRIMVHEATAPTPRLEWIVEHHVRARFDVVSDQWLAVRADGATTIEADPIVIYYTVVGAASLLYVNKPEAHLLLGRDDVVDDSLIDAHADLIVSMLLGDHAPAADRRASSILGGN